MKNLKYLLVIGGLIVFIFIDKFSCSKPVKPSTKTEIDTIYSPLPLEGDSTVIDIIKPSIPLIIYKTDTKILKTLDSLKNENERLEYLVSLLQTKVYDTTYKYNQNVKVGNKEYFLEHSIKVKDSIQGNLLGRKLEHYISNTNIEVPTITKTVTNNIYHTEPKLIISGGLSTGLETDFKTTFQKPFLGGNIGFKNSKGYKLNFTYTTNKNFLITLNKDLIKIK